MKKNPTYAISDNMISSLGFTTQEHIGSFRKGQSGISSFSDVIPFASVIDERRANQEWGSLGIEGCFSKLEKLLILSISKTLAKVNDFKPQNCILILSTTKGNIDGLRKGNSDDPYLWALAKKISECFKFKRTPIVISTACISGTSAAVLAHRFIKMGLHEQVLVVGGDIISDFTMSGFTSFRAIGTSPCRPYDKERDGITLGEGVGSILFSNKKNLNSVSHIKVIGGASSNDANHISGPSRTGDGLFYAIEDCLQEGNVSAEKIGFISAHGTATAFNDEMESKAFNLAGLEGVPINSLKGYFGHTLGAAGILECIATIHSLFNEELYPSLGFSELGVSQSINVISKYQLSSITFGLKTASGFGGCNASILFEKE